VHNALHVISLHSYAIGTATHFHFELDGQKISYTRDEITWQTIDFSLWPDLTQYIMAELEAKVAQQLPDGIMESDLLAYSIHDDLSHLSPHLQEKNREWMSNAALKFRKAMLSPGEQRHGLGPNIEPKRLEQYLLRDQEIRGLLATLVATTTSTCLRSAQYNSIFVNLKSSSSTPDDARNIWILHNRFLLGKPHAKQVSKDFGEVVFWLPKRVTTPLSVLLFFQQPFIDEILGMAGITDHLYGSHLWPMKSEPRSWNGVRRYTAEKLGLGLNCQIVRQIAEAVLRQKFPTFFEAFTFSKFHRAEGSYHIAHVLEPYAVHYGLANLAASIDMEEDRIAACLMVSDVWQAMIKIEPQQPFWQPIATGTYLFPAIKHRDLAYAQAQHLKVDMQLQKLINIKSLTDGLRHLESPDFIHPQLEVSLLIYICELLMSNRSALTTQMLRSVPIFFFGLFVPCYLVREGHDTPRHLLYVEYSLKISFILVPW
jgi:hypothetical protein